ncbi:NAD(P)/FAD-dependent oxidoreductase [Vibrio sinaloensis]|uniref:NAD(P)/FAD-dependent oxidoreductase n=1 Tax=Photobacterium sp. (strain ATCC 43367) TaxID=379097 RepID=UPI0022AED851|nr:NAD(P)/FAD-dependent oxidoreductase [Vibrio sinaloensis]MCZ4295072.1 NAD(P)/FAD-dependent oxidoreductase [Vibrio sinaloensis]
MKIAIIGSGISGLTCGYYLSRDHDITLFEANDYIGGHTATVDVELEGSRYSVDTGFIVYNDRTYPNFIALMNEIGVEGRPSQMSFSVRNDSNGLEYNGHTLTTLFAQKRNWLNPKFYSFIFEILRFNRLVKECVDQTTGENTLGDFLTSHRFSDYFCDNYILPMGAAIWSSTLADMRAFPLQFFARFFLNHGLLDVTNRPQWYVIKGGSREYIKPLTKGFADKIRLNSSVESVSRDQAGVTVRVNGQTERFDQVIFACHSDQAKHLLADISSVESEILSDLAYQPNEVVLHTDESLLPKRKAAWASWNYWLDGGEEEQSRPPTLTYNMNILQHIQAPKTFCVSLNSSDQIDKDKILKSFVYHHPVFSRDSMAAQARRNEINGLSRTWFCGAYWYNGFHEDGVRSGLDVVRGIRLVSETLQSQGAA